MRNIIAALGPVLYAQCDRCGHKSMRPKTGDRCKLEIDLRTHEVCNGTYFEKRITTLKNGTN